jgi:chemotaxis protein MotB
VLIEGHTDSRPITRQDGYTNWELSSDRANAARRLMQGSGVRLDQITQVRGYADQKLRDMAHPDNAVNRRISIVVLNHPA